MYDFVFLNYNYIYINIYLFMYEMRVKINLYKIVRISYLNFVLISFIFFIELILF